MSSKIISPIFLLVAFSAPALHADSAPFGFPNADNFVAHSGNMSDSADIAGRKAGAANILFNFPDADTSNIDGAILAPHAYLSGSTDLGGNTDAAGIGQTGEVHNDSYDGTLPGASGSPTPEPATLFLLGTGLLSIAGLLNRRSKQ